MNSQHASKIIIVIGLLWIMFWCISLADSTVDLVSTLKITDSSQEIIEGGGSGFESTYEILVSTYKYIILIFGFRITLGLLGVVSGIYFIKLRKWALVSLKSLSLVMALYLIALAVYYVKVDQAMEADDFGAGVNIDAMIVIGVFALIFVTLSLYLCSKKISCCFDVQP